MTNGDTPAVPAIRVWRTAMFTQAACWFLLVVTGVGGLVLLTVSAWPTENTRRVDGFVFSAFLCLWTLAMWRFGLHARVEATGEGLIVRNPFRTRHVRWSDVIDVQPSYSGLDIITGPADGITAWAVQEANISSWMHRRSRAIRVAEEILELAREHQGPTVSGPPASLR